MYQYYGTARLEWKMEPSFEWIMDIMISCGAPESKADGRGWWISYGCQVVNIPNSQVGLNGF
jgi:hypothetical protein